MKDLDGDIQDLDAELEDLDADIDEATSERSYLTRSDPDITPHRLRHEDLAEIHSPITPSTHRPTLEIDALSDLVDAIVRTSRIPETSMDLEEIDLDAEIEDMVDYSYVLTDEDSMEL